MILSLPDTDGPWWHLSPSSDFISVFNLTLQFSGSLTCNVSNPWGYLLLTKHISVHGELTSFSHAAPQFASQCVSAWGDATCDISFSAKAIKIITMHNILFEFCCISSLSEMMTTMAPSTTQTSAPTTSKELTTTTTSEETTRSTSTQVVTTLEINSTESNITAIQNGAEASGMNMQIDEYSVMIFPPVSHLCLLQLSLCLPKSQDFIWLLESDRNHSWIIHKLTLCEWIHQIKFEAALFEINYTLQYANHSAYACLPD